MLSFRYQYIFLTLLVCFALPSNAAIYKWKDEAGLVHYGSTPPRGSNAQKMGVSTSFDEAPTPSKNSTKAAKDTNTPTAANDKNAVDKDGYSKAQRTELCKNAKQDISTMNNSGRLRVKQADGSSAVMSDKDRAERMKTMQSMVKKHCK